MAKIEENTKRRSSEVDEQSVAPRPPPKKRFLSRASSPDEDPEESEDAVDTFKEPLETFRKDAIMRQWKEYARLLERCRKNNEQMEANRLKTEDYVRLWEESFRQLQNFLLHTTQSGLLTFGHSDNGMDVNPKELEGLLNQEWTTDLALRMIESLKNKKIYDSALTKLSKLFDAWVSRRENITKGFSSVFNQGALKDIRREHESILNAWANNQRSLLDMKNRYKSANLVYLVLSEELRILNNRLELTEISYREIQTELQHAEKKVDEDTKMAEVTKPTVSTITPSTPVQEKTPVMNTQDDPFIRLQQIVTQRLRDIELIKEDRVVLKQQIARLEMDLVSVPESRIYKAAMCRNLSQSRAYYKDKCNRLSDLCHDIQLRLDDLSGNRRHLIKELDSEQVAHFMELKNQLRKLDDDLMRIRAQRDALQMQLEIGKASTEAGRVSISELKIIADTRKERVNYLETEVLRLQKKMAARTGVKDYYVLLLNSDGREPLLQPLQSQLKQLEEQVEQVKERVYQSHAKEWVDQELAQLSESLQLEIDIGAFTEKYGFHPSSSMSVVQEVLSDRIEQERKAISEAKDKIVNLEATEKQLLSEIESVSNAYGDLEEETMKRVKELAAAEDEIIRLQAERVKYTQTFTSLNKSKDANTMVVNALTKQVEKQLTHIKQMTEREKSLNSQLTCLDRELNASNAVYDVYKQKTDEAKLVLDELKERTISSKDRITELQKSILEKIRMVEEGSHSRLRLEENCELLKRKVESTNKSDRPAEAKLKKEREEYRSLLNCSQCRVRLKSHIILKCMHTFCKECLDAKKRCPSCEEPFSIHDVKQFYF